MPSATQLLFLDGSLKSSHPLVLEYACYVFPGTPLSTSALVLPFPALRYVPNGLINLYFVIWIADESLKEVYFNNPMWPGIILFLS